MNIFEALVFATSFWLLSWVVDFVCSPNAPSGFRTIWLHLWPAYYVGLYLIIIVLSGYRLLEKKYWPTKEENRIQQDTNETGTMRTIVMFGTMLWLIDLGIDFVLPQKFHSHGISIHRWLLCVLGYAFFCGTQWAIDRFMSGVHWNSKKGQS